MKAPQDIILNPVITEASMGNVQQKKYTFRVAKDAKKNLFVPNDFFEGSLDDFCLWPRTPTRSRLQRLLKACSPARRLRRSTQ